MRSIRARLTLWYISLLTFSFIILGGAAYGLLSYSLIREVDNALNGVAGVMAERVHGGVHTIVPSDIDELFKRFFGFSPWERYFRLLDPPGDPRRQDPRSDRLPLSKQALSNASRGVPTFETVEGLESYPIRILTLPVMEKGRPGRLIQVGMSLQNTVETRTRFLLIMAGLLPFGLLCAGLGGWILARRALRPVDRMTEAANRIGAEHLTERVEETGAGDELDRLAQTLNRMLGRLDSAFSQIRLFTANASHELQTPLTIMKGELEVALRSPRTPEEYQDTLKSGLEEIDRMTQLVDDLLLLARTEAGTLRLDRRSTDLALVAEEVYWRLKGMAESRSVNLSPGHLEPVTVYGDREHLSRLMLNLVENGIKYTEPGGSVLLSVHTEGQWAALEVTDTGIGIAEEHRERIF
ncbi:MAG: histidine kinase dimerization/phospho-acceptor domain-containing protein, partial [Syntrophobacteraceae bacterium]